MGFKLYPVSNDLVGFMALRDGRVNLFIANRLVGDFYLKKLGMHGKITFEPFGRRKLYYVAMSKMDEYHKRLLELFSEKLRRFKRANEYRSILSRYGVKYEDIW